MSGLKIKVIGSMKCVICGNDIKRYDYQSEDGFYQKYANHLNFCKAENIRKESEMIIIRDKFAMAALTGLLSDHCIDLEGDEYAKLSYEYADAMLKAREVKNENI